MKINKPLSKDWVILTVIFTLAVVIRLIMVYLYSWNRGPHFENYQIASYIIDGKGYWWDWNHTIPPQPTALLPPIYTYFLVLFMKLFTNPFRLIYITQSFLNALGIIPGFFLGKLLGNRRTGITCACLFAVMPEFALEPAKLISEPLFIPMVILVVFLFLKFKSLTGRELTGNRFFMLGIIIGITTLIKTTGSLIVLAFFISLIAAKHNKKAFYKAAVLMSVGFFLAVSPWLIRNYIVMDKPFMMASNFGYNLWRGNHPWGSGTEYLDDNHVSESALSPEYKEYLEKNRPQLEVELDRFYFNEAIGFIKHDPGRYLKLVFKRMFYFITIDFTHPLTKNIFYVGGYTFVLFFGIWGFIILKRERRLDYIFIIIPLVFFCFYTPIVNVPRFRLVPVLMLLILSSLSVNKLLSKSKLWIRMTG